MTSECPWCWQDVEVRDAVISGRNGLIYHDECLDAFNDMVPDTPNVGSAETRDGEEK